ncbi:MAG: tetratricopeptide repeat protein [Steroidobacteraceae bacterium]
MDEYLSEHEQWEQVKAWLRVNGPWMIAGVALAAIGLSGWNWWNNRQAGNATAAHVRYQAIVATYNRADLAGGEKLADQLIADAPDSPYAIQAQLLTARVEVESGKQAQAAERLAKVATYKADPQIALVARLRLARLQIDQGKADDALKTLAAAEPGAFAPSYDEVRGDALLAKGDKDGALKAYRSARQNGALVVDTELLDLKINELDPS